MGAITTSFLLAVVGASAGLNSVTYFRELLSFLVALLSFSSEKLWEGFMDLGLEEDFDGKEKDKLILRFLS